MPEVNDAQSDSPEQKIPEAPKELQEAIEKMKGALGGIQQGEPLMQFFTYSHLPEHLQNISRPFGELANRLMNDLPRNPERTVALRKLLESKDCAVRASIFKG